MAHLLLTIKETRLATTDFGAEEGMGTRLTAQEELRPANRSHPVSDALQRRPIWLPSLILRPAKPLPVHKVLRGNRAPRGPSKLRHDPHFPSRKDHLKRVSGQREERYLPVKRGRAQLNSPALRPAVSTVWGLDTTCIRDRLMICHKSLPGGGNGYFRRSPQRHPPGTWETIFRQGPLTPLSPPEPPASSSSTPTSTAVGSGA